MKKTGNRTTVRIFTTCILILVIVLLFFLYRHRNEKRISAQNASYIKSSTLETVKRLEDILESGRKSIYNTAKLYGRTLTGPTVDRAELEELADGTLFDYVGFLDAQGRDIDTRTDMSDMPYFQRGMAGESGIDNNVYISPVTGEKIVIVYAPVRYQGEIIGVLTGQYQEERMTHILSTTMFDEPVTSLLCLEDGTIVSGIGMKRWAYDALGYMADRVSVQDREEIRRTLAEERQYGFSYDTDKGKTMAYMASLPGNRWTLIQFFPVDALNQMQFRVNQIGIALEAGLIALFVVYMMSMLVLEWREQKRLVKEKQGADRIINGVNKLFSRFILVDFRRDHYQYINGMRSGYEEITTEGSYTEFQKFLAGKFTEAYGALPMEQILTAEYIQNNFRGDTPYELYEYQIQRGQERIWQSMAIIVLEKQDGEPVSVLLAVQDINGQKERELRTQEALREAYRAAEAANRAKSEFLSRMSHDIRTPMNAIMGMTSIAAMHLEDSERVGNCLNKISISGKHLLRLINEVLDMSKIESGKLELVEEEFDLSDTVNELLGIFQPQIAAGQQQLSVALGGLVHEKVIGDGQRLSQILVNIMGNAVKFTPAGGQISLNIKEFPSPVQGSRCYEFLVSDTGIGMEQEFVDQIFEPFSRASDSRTSKTEGSGLGMAIARNIAKMMGGDIRVASKKGEGTSIRVTVFLQSASENQEALEELEGKRILVLDDEQVVCENASIVLEALGMQADCFTDGDAAIEALVRGFGREDAAGVADGNTMDTVGAEEAENYAAVLVDWRMPGKDGLQVIREIREKIGSQLPVIVLSGYDWSEIQQEAKEAGADEIISKPLFKSRLIHVLKKVLLGEKEISKDPVALLQQEERFAGRRILLVEDNQLNIEIANELLTTLGLLVDQAENGKEAVDRLMETEPGTYDLVFMDIQMPVMNGYEAARAIRRAGREDLQTLPIVAMTADAFSEDIRKAEESGMNGHIAKPVDIAKLMEMLRIWVK